MGGELFALAEKEEAVCLRGKGSFLTWRVSTREVVLLRWRCGHLNGVGVGGEVVCGVVWCGVVWCGVGVMMRGVVWCGDA